MKTKWYIACGMRRSASTWQYLVLRDLINGMDAGWVIHQNFDSVVESLDGKYKNVVLKTHPFLFEFCNWPKRLLQDGRLFPVYIYRDLRDVFASMKRLHSKIEYLSNNWPHELAAIVDVDRKWRSVDGIYTGRYENMIFNPALELLRMSVHLRISLKHPAAYQIAEYWSIKRNAERMPEAGLSTDNMLWSNHIDGGTVGRWQQELTFGEKIMVHEEFGDWLRENYYLED